MAGATEWDPPADWTRLRTIDAHAGGEPLRIVLDGFPDLEGETVLERRRHVEAHHDHLRTALMWEPRGHADMYGALTVEPETDDADMGVVFMHNEGYSTMCGHGIIALATVAVETGLLGVEGTTGPLRFDTPAGTVAATPDLTGERVGAVTFENVPSFVYTRDRSVDVSGVGEVPYDVAFGGAFYAYCEADDLGVELVPGEHEALVRLGRAVKAAVADDLAITHPVRDGLGFLYGVIISGPSRGEGADRRNVCVFADGEVDRSPTGTGISGHLALAVDRGDLEVGEGLVVESLVGSTFTGHVVGRTSVGGTDAVVPAIRGSAHVTGRAEFLVDPNDPLGEGFLLR